MHKVDAYRGLTLQLRVTQPIPLLEDEELHHDDRVCVGASSHWALVAVHGLDDGCEGVPVDVFLCFGQLVVVYGCFIVYFSEQVSVKGVHASRFHDLIYKPTRGV